jgi:GNAT superfamily N-acetyltransferase
MLSKLLIALSRFRFRLIQSKKSPKPKTVPGHAGNRDPVQSDTPWSRATLDDLPYVSHCIEKGAEDGAFAAKYKFPTDRLYFVNQLRNAMIATNGESQQLFIARLGDLRVGIAFIVPQSGVALELNLLFVEDRYRRHGIGSRALDELCTSMEQQHIPLVVRCKVQSVTMIRLLQKRHFRVVDTPEQGMVKFLRP